MGQNQAFWFGSCLAFAGIAWPNKSVKGTRRPVAVFEIRFLSRFGGFVLAQ